MRADEGAPYGRRVMPGGSSVATIALLLAACATPARLPVPASLDPPAGEALVMELAARGVQVYECRAKAGAAPAQEWAFVAPQADLFDASGRRVATHGAGPHWLAPDGSRIEGTVKARADAPTAGAIPWLLLAARSTGSPGTFARVTSVQRVDTVAGAAPSTTCGPENLGASVRVPYTAVYRFFGA